MLTLPKRGALNVLLLASPLLLGGCNTVLMNASGDVAVQQGRLIVVSTLLMLLITILVYVLVPFSSLCLHHYSVYLVPSSSIALALMHLVVFDTGF